MQLIPTLFLLTAALFLVSWAFRIRPPKSIIVWIMYLGASVLSTLLNIQSVPALALTGVGGILIPLAAIVIGMTLPISFIGRLARLFSVFIFVSILFGTYQFVFGPSSIDQAWANATHEYSMEGAKVFDVMTIYGSEFRPYGYYADHTTWGLFLAMALTVIIVAFTLGLYPKKWLYLLVPMALLGLVECETRVAWLAFIGTLVTYRLLTVRLLRRPFLVIVGILASFAIVIVAGEYAVQHLSFGRFSSGILNRYATVGTLEARTSAWRLFVRNLPAHWLRGTGFGFVSADQNVSTREEVYSHSMYVEILVVSGLPGLIFFLSFFYFWIKEAFWVARNSRPELSRMTVWFVALVVGMLVTGSIQGALFMTVYLCLLLGMVSGEWMRLQGRSTASIPLVSSVPYRPWQANPKPAFQL